MSTVAPVFQLETGPVTDWPAPTPASLQHYAEELANSVTHGMGLCLAMIGAYVLMLMPGVASDPWRLAGCAIYSASLVALYAGSTGYHSIMQPQWKKTWRLIDHSCIYLLIAGSYTPFLLTHLRDHGGLTLMAVLWLMAAIGIACKLWFGVRYRLISTLTYVGMGWLALVQVQQILTYVPGWGVFWIVAGGLAYTAGVYYYLRDHRPFHHAIWHLFVLAGSACHYYAVLYYVADLA